MAAAHRLDRTLVVRAARETVFEYVTDSTRWAEWWGRGSTIDARPGGRVLIRHPNGVEVSGDVLDAAPPSRITFTYGYASGTPIPPGGSVVTIRLDRHPEGALLQVTHECPDAAARDEHVQGWRFQLSLLANLVANRVAGDVAASVDRWFAAWSEPDGATRDRILDGTVSADVRVRDRFSCIQGLDDVKAHLAAVHRFMPGLRMERRGAARYCQWHAVADWVALGSDGAERGHGTNAFEIDADGRVRSVTGFWAG